MATMVPASTGGNAWDDDEEEFGFPDYDSEEEAEEEAMAIAAVMETARPTRGDEADL